MKNKNILLLCSFLAAGVIAPVFAAESKVSVIPSDIVTSLDEMLAHSRVSVGASRDSVVNELRQPNLVLNANVWIYTGFRATNVVGAERFDALIVAFQHDKVVKITLANADQVRTAAARSASGASKMAQR